MIKTFKKAKRIYKRQNDGTEHTWSRGAEYKSRRGKKNVIKLQLTDLEMEILAHYKVMTGNSIYGLVKEKMEDTIEHFNDVGFEFFLQDPDLNTNLLNFKSWYDDKLQQKQIDVEL